MKQFTTTLIFSVFALQITFAQSPKKSTPTVKESMGEIKESFKAIGNIFKKKDKKDDNKQVADTQIISTQNASTKIIEPATAEPVTDSIIPVSIKDIIVAGLIKNNSKQKSKLSRTETVDYLDLQFDFGEGVRNSAYFSKLKKENMFGDLNNDGKEDAIIKVYSNSGGNSEYLDIYVFLQQQDGWKLALVKSSSDADIKGCEIGQFVPEQISNGYLLGKSSCLAASDPRCCPSLYYNTTLKFTNNKLVMIKKEKQAKSN